MAARRGGEPRHDARSPPSAPGARPRCGASPRRSPDRRSARPAGDRLRERAELRRASRLNGASASTAVARATLSAMSRSISSTAPQSLIVRCSMRDLLGAEVGIAEELVEQARAVRGQPLPRDRDEHGALALAQVVAARLAGDLGVAEDAEQVVAQLVGDAEGQAEPAQRVELRRRSRPAMAPPITRGDSTVYFADLYTITRSARVRCSSSGCDDARRAPRGCRGTARR